MIQKIYDNMWSNFCSSLENEQCEIDLHIGNANDTRRGITALAYLESNSQEVVNEIVDFLKPFQQIEPEQYYHPANELHLTLLSIISCVSGFRLSDINPAEYAEIFYQALKEIDQIEIEFKGVTASSSCIVIQGFPLDTNLKVARDNLRKHFKTSGLRASIDSRYKIETAHVSAMRFCSPIKDISKLKTTCQKFKNHNFGIIKLTNFELVFNNWYQNLSVTKQLAEKKGS